VQEIVGQWERVGGVADLISRRSVGVEGVVVFAATAVERISFRALVILPESEVQKRPKSTAGSWVPSYTTADLRNF
jgi:hypothetical protein